jgi:CRISPR-associated protein Cas2
MVVLILERATKAIRGEISRWMIEPRANVFIGRMTSTVREQIWESVCKKRVGSAMIVYPAHNEQGYRIETNRDPSRQIVEVDGLQLVRIPPYKAKFDAATKGMLDA